MRKLAKNLTAGLLIALTLLPVNTMAAKIDQNVKVKTFTIKKQVLMDDDDDDEEDIDIEDSAEKGKDLVEYAKNFIGVPYVYGGTSHSSGVDCSGFTQQVYAHFGVKLQRTSRDQYAGNGKSVSRSQLQAGDLVFYGYGSVNHVAIYVGNSQIIHAPTPGKSVCIVPMEQRGDAPIIGYKRIFND